MASAYNGFFFSSDLKEREFMRVELLRLEALGCITRVVEQPFVVLPLSVVFSRKLRLVVDASRGLNPFLEDRRVKLEDLEMAEDVLRRGDFQSKSDLDSGKSKRKNSRLQTGFC